MDNEKLPAIELSDEELKNVTGGKGDPLTNRSSIDEVKEGMNVFAFDSINLVHRWGMIVSINPPAIDVSFGGGVAFVDGNVKNLTPCTVTLQEFWLSPTEF